MRRFPAAQAFALASSLCLASIQQPDDPAGAERQYRIARRLVAENSPDARRALSQVIELDPTGELADDALLDQALLLEPPEWPEDLGRIDVTAVQSALVLLDRLLEQLPSGDRAVQARYLRALLLLEPLAGRNASRARVELLSVASSHGAAGWAQAARYALAWLAEHGAQREQALAAYHRLWVDDPSGVPAVRARVALGRALLREGTYGRAARWLEQAIEAGAAPELDAESLRDLAVRLLLHDAQASAAIAASPPISVEAPIREPVGLCAMPTGGVMIADRKEGRIVELDRAGVAVGDWRVEQVEALAVDSQGRVYASAGGWLQRVTSGGRLRRVAPLGDYAPTSGIAVDDAGACWILDRRGQRIGYLAPGAQSPRPLWEDRSLHLEALVWDGLRVVVADSRTRRLLAIGDAGALRAIVTTERRPVALAVDPAGRLAVADDRGTVTVYRPNGSVFESFAATALGVGRLGAVAFGNDGSLHGFDPSASRWVKRP